MSQEFPMAHANPRVLELANNYTTDGDATHANDDRRMDPAIWASDYRHDLIPLHKNFCEAEQEIRNILSNPTLPKRCGELLAELMRLANKSTLEIGKVLQESAIQFPAIYPDVESFDKASPDWLVHRCRRQIENMQPKIDELANYVRQYFMVDELYATQRKASR